MKKKVLNFVYTNTKEHYTGKILILVNIYGSSSKHNIAISIYNILASMPNEFYTIIINSCNGIGIIPFLAAKKKNRFSLTDTSISLIYEKAHFNNKFYRKFESELLFNETGISKSILNDIFFNGKEKKINSIFFDSYQIAKVINNFSELPIQLYQYDIINS